MNERIRQLAEQAKLKTELWNNPEPFVIYKEDVNYPGGLEKFAKLIVQECLSEIKGMMVDKSELLYEHEETTECVNEALMDAHHNISIHFGFAEHFGVEE